MKAETKYQSRIRRHKKVRVKIKRNEERPRLCVFKSSKHIYAQLIDDEKGKTIVSASDLELKKETKSKTGGKTDEGMKKAQEVGKIIAEKAVKNKIKKVTFDRGPYRYHGKIKALAEEARKGGLVF